MSQLYLVFPGEFRDSHMNYWFSAKHFKVFLTRCDWVIDGPTHLDYVVQFVPDRDDT